MTKTGCDKYNDFFFLFVWLQQRLSDWKTSESFPRQDDGELFSELRFQPIHQCLPLLSAGFYWGAAGEGGREEQQVMVVTSQTAEGSLLPQQKF